jgi:hypothetical protein
VVKAHHGMDATAVDVQPVLENKSYWAMFFLLFIVTSNFFFLNLFVGLSNPSPERVEISSSNAGIQFSFFQASFSRSTSPFVRPAGRI